MSDTIPEWLEGLPKELHDSKALQVVSDVEMLAKNYVEQDKSINSSIRLPKDDDESKQKFGERLDTLGFAPKQTVPEDYGLDPIGDKEWQKGWQEKRVSYYKDLGMTQTQAEKAFKTDSDQLTSMQDDTATAVTALKTKYGDKLPALMDGARKAIADLGLESIDNSPHGSNLKWTEHMIEIGKNYSEDGKVAGGEGISGEDMEQVETDLLELRVAGDELFKAGKMTQGSPAATLHNRKLNALLARKHGLENGETLGDVFVKDLHA